MPREKSPSAIELLQQICDIMEERDLTEVDLCEEGLTVKVRRGSEPVPVAFAQPSDAVPLPSAEQVEASAAPLSPEVGELVRSPMVGLFYASQSPEAAAYVEVGSVVSEDDTLCLIEAMKIFNEVKPDFPCEILEILVEDTTTVEFDQPLFRVKRI
ncbi:acetyl-CoA carboxylase biotin carboxyl carrier protein [Candidatus Poribacteria bacterium]|nr:acetyl-CoA carboxylase biotin carboxyl carrier protein [Candidatus Poribacteria bacterium]